MSGDLPDLPPVRYEVIQLKGGLDQVTPTLGLKPGYAKDAVNFECSVTGGYSRVAGYERYDGRAKPSDAVYSSVTLTTFTNTPSVGETITGTPSGATGVVVGVGSSYIALTKVSGVFAVADALTVGATAIGTISALGAVIDVSLEPQYLAEAADQYRADIAKPTGSGAVRGVMIYGDNIYAFRNNAGGTACDMWKATAAGWSQVAFEYEISFSNANTSVEDADVLTQGGVTATIRRVLVETGTLVSGTNTGRLVISVAAGGNFAAGAATTTGGGSLTLSGAETAITLLPGGHFEYDIANFSGTSQTKRLYGCDGVNRGFEFDGSYFVPIATGTATDTPKHVKAHKNHLCWAFDSSLIHSGIGAPYNYTTTAGASEIAVGDTITNFLTLPGDSSSAALAIFCASTTHILYGTAANDWNRVPYPNAAGASHYSAQQMTHSYAFDQRGVVTLQTSQNYGNFDSATLTNNIKTFISEKRSKLAATCIANEKSQYRLFFNDGWGLYMTAPNGKWIGSMPVYFPDPIYCATQGRMSDGTEMMLAGSSDGYVYEMDKGTSFDGAAINYTLTLNFDSIGSPRILKSYKRCSIEVTGNGYTSIGFSYQLGYNSSLISQPTSVNYATSFTSGYWDSFTWDNFTWDGITIGPTECEMEGTAENVALVFAGSDNYTPAFTINSAIIHFITRRGLR